MLILGALFLGYQSIRLTQFIIELDIKSIWLILLLSWMLSLFITGFFALFGFALPTQRLLTNQYYYISNPKKLNAVYRFLQVNLFRNLLLLTLWRSKKMQKGHFSGVKAGLDQLELQSKKSEFGHVVPFVITVAISLYLVVIDKGLFAICISVFNLVGNLYPVLLQRHHRMRLQKISNRKN